MEISFGEPFSQESESYMAYKNPLGHSRVLWLSWEIGQRSFRKIKMIEKGNESPTASLHSKCHTHAINICLVQEAGISWNCNWQDSTTQWAGVGYHKRSWLSTALCSKSDGLIWLDQDSVESIHYGKWIISAHRFAWFRFGQFYYYDSTQKLKVSKHDEVHFSTVWNAMKRNYFYGQVDTIYAEVICSKPSKIACLLFPAIIFLPPKMDLTSRFHFLACLKMCMRTAHNSYKTFKEVLISVVR